MVMAVVMAPVRGVRNSASAASGIAGVVTLNLSSAFTAELSGVLLFVRQAIVQPLLSNILEHGSDKLIFYVSSYKRTPRSIIFR